MIDYKKAGQRIKEQRKKLGLTQEGVSEKVGITPSYFSQIESGIRKAGIKTFVSISNVLGVSLDYILCDTHKELSHKDLDDIEYQIIHHLKKFPKKDKKFILDMILLLEKNQ